MKLWKSISLVSSLLVLATSIAACKSAGKADVASIALEKTPPKNLYHFGEYQHLIDYGSFVGPPSEAQWQSIPSNGNGYSPGRRGLYGSQHPAYNERYAGNGHKLLNGPWLINIVLVDDDGCQGPYSGDVVEDSNWPGSGFWIVTNRECIQDIEAAPTGVLKLFATTAELWHKSPFQGQSRYKDNGNLATRVLHTILLRAMTLVQSIDPSDLYEMAVIANSSDLLDVKARVVRTIELAAYCQRTGQWQELIQS